MRPTITDIDNKCILNSEMIKNTLAEGLLDTCPGSKSSLMGTQE